MTCERLDIKKVIGIFGGFGPSKIWPLENHWWLRIYWWFGGVTIELNPSEKEIMRSHLTSCKCFSK
jgi:hypothetical protein